MRLCKVVLIGLLAIAANTPVLVHAELLIPRSRVENANYYLLTMAIKGDVVVASSSRISALSASYSKTETNCKTTKMRELGYGESLSAMTIRPTKWFDLVDGSSKSDLANFVCAIKAVLVVP
ncbi:MAG: hypothetical protein JKY34_12590 [Kordiimonadaceae bacterium]|nr:hypothetical protein [Kordiimonadaceae bacterium]